MGVRSRSMFAAGIIAICLSAACASTSINKVLSDPSRYRNNDVTVSGAVVDSFSVADHGAYRIEDKSGQLWVVSTKGVPRTGARVSVTGTIRDAYDLGNLGGRINLPAAVSSGLVMVESSHKAK
jgi:hypothetical protein